MSSIACELHDYLEIACMYGYRIKITLKNGQQLEGKAVDTFTSAEKKEFLIVQNENKEKIELGSLAKIQVLNPQAKFKEIHF